MQNNDALPAELVIEAALEARRERHPTIGDEDRTEHFPAEFEFLMSAAVRDVETSVVETAPTPPLGGPPVGPTV